MKKLLSSAAALILMVLAFSSCVYYVDRPYVYTDQATQQYPNDTSYSYSYAPRTVSFVILRIYDNRYVFYDNNDVIAVWIFQTNGTLIKRGRVINGLVKIFYGPEIPAAEIMYRNNERDGFCRFYHKNGRPMEFGEYKNGSRYGTWKRFNDSGALDEEFVFSGSKITYKLKSKASASKASMREFDYLDKEHEYKKQVKQEMDKKDIYPVKYKRVFGENPYENREKMEAPADVDRGASGKDRKPEGDKYEESDKQGIRDREKYDGTKGNAYGRDKEDNDRKDFKGEGGSGAQEDPAVENTPVNDLYKKPGRDAGNKGRNEDDENGKIENRSDDFGLERNDSRDFPGGQSDKAKAGEEPLYKGSGRSLEPDAVVEDEKNIEPAGTIERKAAKDHVREIEPAEESGALKEKKTDSISPKRGVKAGRQDKKIVEEAATTEVSDGKERSDGSESDDKADKAVNSGGRGNSNEETAEDENTIKGKSGRNKNNR